MRRVDLGVRSLGSGCPVHTKLLLPVLVVWAPPRKKRNQEQNALNRNTSASAASSSCGTIPGTGSKRHRDGTFVVLPLRGAAALDPRPRMRLRRKTSVSQLQDAHEPAETCEARYPGRDDVYHEFDCAGTLRELLQKKITILRVQLGPPESAHGFGDTVSCPLCLWLQLKNGKGCLYMHLVRHHGPEKRFVCSGTKQLCAVMALHQCDLFCGGRPADHLARSAQLIRCSVGPLSCTRRLRVDGECRVLLTAFGPKFVCKDIGSGAVAARRVGNVFLRYLKQTADRMHMTMNRLKRDIPARSHAPRAPEDDVASGGGHRPQSRRLGVEVRSVRRPSVSGRLPRAKRGRHREDRHGCPPERRGDALDPWRLTAGPRSVRADNAYVARCCLGPCRGPQRQQTPCCRVRPGERGAPRRRGGCALGSRGQRVAGVARRTVVVVSISSWSRAGHVPPPDEVRGRGLASRFSGLQDSPSACQQVQRVLPFRCLPGNRQFTANEVFFYDHLCRASLLREHIDAAVTSMKSAEVWSGLAEWVRPGGCRDSVPRRDETQAFPDGEVQAAVVDGGCDVPEVPVVLEQCTTVAHQQAALLGTGTCGEEALHAEVFSGRRFKCRCPHSG